MVRKIFDFDTEFKFGIDSVDREHVQLVNMLNQVHSLLDEGKRDEARRFFTTTLSSYVNDHFAHEEAFMESIGFPFLNEHKKIHENFRKSFQDLLPLIASCDEAAFRQALSDAFTWIINHIGKTDKKYANYYLSQYAVSKGLPQTV